jgi:hypothetical protein
MTGTAVPAAFFMVTVLAYGRPVFSSDRQGVDIRPQENCFARTVPENCDDTVSAYARGHLVAERSQAFGEQGGGPLLL